MKELLCNNCETSNKIEFSLRPGTKGPIMIRCQNCKKLLEVDIAEAKGERV